MQPELPEDMQRWLLRALDHLILITDRDLNIIGDPISEWTTLDATVKFNEPGSGLFTVPGLPAIREQLVAGARVVVVRSGEVLISGPYESSLYERSDDGVNAGDGVLTVNFSDDLARVVARQVYPAPTLAPAAQNVDKWTMSGSGEQILRALVDLNAGPGALTARQIPQLVLGNLQGIGTTITTTADRMEPIGDVLRRAALASGIGFRVVQVEETLQFQCYDPRDLSAEVRFSFGIGNLRYLGYEVSAPTATAAIVGGQGDGAARALIERVNTVEQAAWGRMETLVSRPGDAAAAELQADGDEALAEGAPTARLQVSAVDTPDQRYGEHYGIGDLVAVEPWTGTQLVDTVLTVHIQVWPTAGEVVSSTIGSQAATADKAFIRRLRAIDRRVGRLERNLSPGVP